VNVPWIRLRRDRLAALGFAVVLGASVAACESILSIGNRVLDPELADGAMPVPDGQVDSTTGVDSGTGPADSGTKDTSVAAEAGVDAGPCGDTTSSSANCGRCGHDCLGGMCEAGVCQPVTLAAMSIKPSAIAVDDASVYWTDPTNGVLMQADKATGNNQVELFTTSSASNNRIQAPQYLTIDATNLYVADSTTGYIVSCAIGGCGGNPTTVALLNAGSSYPGPLAVDATYVYAANVGQDTVWRAVKTGGMAPQMVTSTVDGGATPYAVGVDTTSVYFTNFDGTVQKAPLAGGPATLLATGAQAYAGGIWVANGTVYFTNAADPAGTVNSVPAAGGAGSTIIQASQHTPVDVKADANNLYWVDQGSNPGYNDGSVLMCPLTSCTAPTVLASGQLYPVAIAVDATGVYWASEGPNTTVGGIYKVAKP
jgi:hypothetical protein